MKTLLLLPALIAVLSLLPAGRVTAQTFTTLYSFTAAPGPYITNSDGAYPDAGLTASGNTLYGTAGGGGIYGAGTVFALNTDGTGFTNLHNFTVSEGASPSAGLILSGNTLYGTVSESGYGDAGTVFAVNTDGTGFTNLHDFDWSSPSNGAHSVAGLVLSGNTLFGTTEFGGSSGPGTVFAVNTDGTAFRILHSFSGLDAGGGNPAAGLILSGNTLYGTAAYGGSSGNGTIFAVNTDGTGFTNLHSFTATPHSPVNTINNNSDGANPYAGLILSGNTLYGTAYNGGSSGVGTVFRINTNGAGFTNLHSFTGGSDGAFPRGGLILSDNTVYGMTEIGGTSGFGMVFAVNTDGTGFTNLHSFDYDDGIYPHVGLILSGNTLYGTVSETYSGPGTVFSISLPLPRLEQINNLIALVQSMGLQPGTLNSLVVKLQGAASALDRGNLEAACGNLGAFLNEANAQKGKKLTTAQGDLLNAEAARIRAVLGCR